MTYVSDLTLSWVWHPNPIHHRSPGHCHSDTHSALHSRVLHCDAVADDAVASGCRRDCDAPEEPGAVGAPPIPWGPSGCAGSEPDRHFFPTDSIPVREYHN